MPQFVVVGAGPAGCSAALTMARLPGAKVQVIERRSLESLNTAVNNPRSYPMLLNGRSRRLFEELGAELPCIEMPFDSVETVPPTVSVRPGDRSAIVTRNQLAYELLQEASANPAISLHFDTCPAALDIANKRVFLESTPSHGSAPPSSADENAQAVRADLDAAPVATLTQASEKVPESLEYDLLLGADGAGSKVRGMLEEGGFVEAREVFKKPLSTYKTFKDIAIPEGGDPAFGFSDPATPPNQNLWFLAPKEESGLNFKIAIWRNGAGRVSGMVPGQGASRALEAPLTPGLLRDSFRPGSIPEWFLQPFCDQLNLQPNNDYGSIRKVDKFHAPGVVLLGDSAHAVTSSLGQGCNTAMESVRVFGEVLEECLEGSEGDGGKGGGMHAVESLEKVPEKFTARRQADAHALQRLELLNCLNVSKPSEEAVKADIFSRVHAKVVWWLMIKLKLPFFEKTQDENVPFSELLRWVNAIGAAAYTAVLALLAAVGASVWMALSSGAV